jgi:hypothetical protein
MINQDRRHYWGIALAGLTSLLAAICLMAFYWRP